MYLMDTPLNFDVILLMMKFFYHSQPINMISSICNLCNNCSSSFVNFLCIFYYV